MDDHLLIASLSRQVERLTEENKNILDGSLLKRIEALEKENNSLKLKLVRLTGDIMNHNCDLGDTNG